MEPRKFSFNLKSALRVSIIVLLLISLLAFLHKASSPGFGNNQVPTLMGIPSVSAVNQLNGSGSVKTSSTLPVCSHSLLRSHFAEHHRFPEVKMDGRYASGTCKFRKCDIFTSFKSKGIDFIFLLGDSQGKRSFKGLISYLERLPGVKCKTILRTSIEDTFQRYFSRGRVTVRSLANISEVIKSCSSCICQTSICRRKGDGFEIKVEYVGLFGWHGIPLRVSGYPGLGTFQCSFTEYLFKYYLKDNYPDLVVLFSLFNHLKREIPIENSAFKKNLLSFLDLLQSTLPRSSSVQWLTNPMEFEKTKTGAAEKYKGKRYSGYLAGEVMYIFSRWLYDTLAEYLMQPESHHLGFFNVANMTSSLVDRSLDGTHLEDSWYIEFMKYTLNTICNGL